MNVGTRIAATLLPDIAASGRSSSTIRIAEAFHGDHKVGDVLIDGARGVRFSSSEDAITAARLLADKPFESPYAVIQSYADAGRADVYATQLLNAAGSARPDFRWSMRELTFRPTADPAFPSPSIVDARQIVNLA